MAATTSNPTPRRNGFDFAALTATAGPKDSADEVARLRAAIETLSELVVAHGVMDARTLASLLGDLVQPAPMQPMALSAPLPPPAMSAAEARSKPQPQKIAPKAAAPVAARKPAPAPVAVAPAPIAPAPVAVAPAPVAVAPAPVAVAPVPVAAPAPAPIASTFVATPAPAPVAAKPVEKPAAKPSPFAPTSVDAARLAAELTDLPPPALKPPGFFSRLFGKKKTSPAAVAAAAESVEFTERTPKLPDDTLYAEQQRATELSFPPPSTVKKPRPAAAARKKSASPVDAAPAKFCDRCWRRMDASGTCKTCSPSA